MNRETELNVGDAVVVVTEAEAAEAGAELSMDGLSWIFPETGSWKIRIPAPVIRKYGGQTAVITRRISTAGHYHYMINLTAKDTEYYDAEFTPSAFSCFAEEGTVEPPDPQDMWYFLGIQSAGKGKRKE